MKRLTEIAKKAGWWGLGLFVVLLIVASRLQWIPAGYVGLVYSARGGLQRVAHKPQVKFIGFWEQLYLYPTRLQAAIYTQSPAHGEVKAADGILITTSDAANTIFDVTVLYRVKPEDVFTVFDRFGPIPIEEVQSLHIRRAIREAGSAIGNRYDVFALMGPKRQEASEEITKELRERLGPKGITIEMAMLNTAYPTGDIGQKITSRVNAYTQLEIAKLEQQIAEIQRQSSVIAGEAAASARTMTAVETKDKTIEMLNLELEERAIEKWKEGGGQLPPIIVRPGQSVIVNGSGMPVVTR